MDNAMSSSAYWTNRAAEIDAAAAEEASYRASYAGRLEAAQRRWTLVTSDAAFHTDEERAEALAALNALRAEADVAFAAVWTHEKTTARRAAWNALVRSGAFGRAKVDPRKVAEQERRQGWTVADLKRAVALHSL